MKRTNSRWRGLGSNCKMRFSFSIFMYVRTSIYVYGCKLDYCLSRFLLFFFFFFFCYLHVRKPTPTPTPPAPAPWTTAFSTLATTTTTTTTVGNSSTPATAGFDKVRLHAVDEGGWAGHQPPNRRHCHPVRFRLEPSGKTKVDRRNITNVSGGWVGLGWVGKGDTLC